MGTAGVTVLRAGEVEDGSTGGPGDPAETSSVVEARASVAHGDDEPRVRAVHGHVEGD